ncbi:MAG: hypothetical protein E7017_03020 [Alphaproteobacteria bacterium]|nr:hypothetical protein [Alphaproteobacteria bacterium]
MKKLTLTAIGLALLCSNNAEAAGYQLNEYSVTGLGRSFAGAGVVGDDYSALAYNPAGMTLMKRSGFQGSMTMAEMASTIKGKGDYEGEETKMHYGVALPSGFGHWNVNDKLFVGAGIYAPYGLSTKHKSASFIGNTARKSELEVIDSSLAAAYKVTDKLSLGATATLRYIHGNMTSNSPFYPGVSSSNANYDLDGWTGTGTIGAMYEFTPDTRLGISYKFRSIQKVKGDFSVDTRLGAMVFSDGEASPDLPASVLISGYHKLNDKIGLSSSIRWTEWSKSFPEFEMTSSGPGSNVTHPYKWRDTWTVAVGADYYFNDNWTFRIGTAYDQSPAEDPANRSNRIPDSDRIWLSAGLSYSADNWQIDAGVAHLFMKKADINMPEKSVYSEYSSYSNMYGLNFMYKF